MSDNQDPKADSKEPPHLEPAHPDALRGGRAEWMPRIPWVPLLVMIGLVAGAYLVYQRRQEQKREDMRAGILRAYASNVAPLATRYQRFVQRIEDMAHRAHASAAGANPMPQQIAPGFALPYLHDAAGLYLRIPRAAAEGDVAAAASQMGRDAILGCMGIAPMSARGLYVSGEFLQPAWLASVRRATDAMRLRVLDYELSHRVQVDAPVVAALLDARYMLLILEGAEIQAPVDVFVFDLRDDRLLFAKHIVPDGVLIPVRLQFEGVRVPASRPQNALAPSAFDCSIAAQIKAALGEPAMDVHTDVAAAIRQGEANAAGVDASADAGADDAGSTDAGVPPRGRARVSGPPGGQ